MVKESTVYLLLGSNLEPRLKYLNEAKSHINSNIGSIINLSSIYESEPWGFVSEMSFLNQIVSIQTVTEPSMLLKQCKAIEKKLGRKKKSEKGYESREIDIDILYYDDKIIHSENLQIPHPQIANRRFTLLPLVELAAEKIHPVLQVSQKQLLADCTDNGKVWIFKSEHFHEI